MCATLFSASVMAQEVTEYQSEDAGEVNVLQQYNAEPYSQTPVRESIRNSKNRRVRTNVDVGAGFSSSGSFNYVLPEVAFQPAKRWQVSVDAGVMYSNFKAPVFSDYTETPNYQNLRAITNYYKAEASYLASERLLITGSILYGQNRYGAPRSKYSSNNDSYMCSFGATYQITPAFSIGFEVSQYHNMYPMYGGYGYPYRRF